MPGHVEEGLFKHVVLVDPTREENLPLVLELWRILLKNEAGCIPYDKTYWEQDKTGYLLIYDIMVFKRHDGIFCLDMIELLPWKSSMGAVYRVVRSAMYDPEKNTLHFDESSQKYLNKHVWAEDKLDKVGKPPISRRRAIREAKIISEIPYLSAGAASALMLERSTVLRMPVVPGICLAKYKENAEYDGYIFLQVACALLEQIPLQANIRLMSDQYKDQTVIHGDIKLANTMIEIKDGEVICRLIDFGLAKPVKTMPHSTSLFYGSIFAVEKYIIDPVTNKFTYDLKSDEYALYVMLFELAGGVSLRVCPKHSGQTTALGYDSLDFSSIFSRFQWEDGFKQEMTELFERMLSDKRSVRPSAQEVLPILQAKMLELEPSSALKPEASGSSQAFQLADLSLHSKKKVTADRDDYSELLYWIKKFHTIKNALTAEEYNGFIENLPKFKFESALVRQFFTYKLYEQNTRTAIKLLLRHNEQIKGFKIKASFLSEKFRYIKQSLPLIMGSAHNMTALRLARQYQNGIVYFCKFEKEHAKNPMVCSIREMLDEQKAMSCEEWYSGLEFDLIPIMRLLNHFYRITNTLNPMLNRPLEKEYRLLADMLFYGVDKVSDNVLDTIVDLAQILQDFLILRLCLLQSIDFREQFRDVPVLDIAHWFEALQKADDKEAFWLKLQTYANESLCRLAEIDSACRRETLFVQTRDEYQNSPVKSIKMLGGLLRMCNAERRVELGTVMLQNPSVDSVTVEQFANIVQAELKAKGALNNPDECILDDSLYNILTLFYKDPLETIALCNATRQYKEGKKYNESVEKRLLDWAQQIGGIVDDTDFTDESFDSESDPDEAETSEQGSSCRM